MKKYYYSKIQDISTILKLLTIFYNIFSTFHFYHLKIKKFLFNSLPYACILLLVCPFLVFAQSENNTRYSFKATIKEQTKNTKSVLPIKTATKNSVTFNDISSSSEITLPSVNELERANQMILLAVERIKTGNYNEAKEVALQMIKLAEKYLSNTTTSSSTVTTDQKVENSTVYKSFANKLEEKIYLRSVFKDELGKNQKLVSVVDPISDGYYLLAIIDFQQGNVKSAIDNINKAVEWNPVRAAYYIERAFLILNYNKNNKEEDFVAALANYLRALEFSYSPSDFAAALRGLGFIYIEEKKLELALACYLVSLLYEPNNEVANKEIAYIKSLNPALVSRYDIKRAQETLSKNGILIKYNPMIFDAILDIVKDLEKNKNISKDELQKWLDYAKSLDPQNEKIIKELQKMKVSK